MLSKLWIIFCCTWFFFFSLINFSFVFFFFWDLFGVSVFGLCALKCNEVGALAAALFIWPARTQTDTHTDTHTGTLRQTHTHRAVAAVPFLVPWNRRRLLASVSVFDVIQFKFRSGGICWSWRSFLGAITFDFAASWTWNGKMMNATSIENRVRARAAQPASLLLRERRFKRSANETAIEGSNSSSSTAQRQQRVVDFDFNVGVRSLWPC